jgi:hypothetical protein
MRKRLVKRVVAGALIALSGTFAWAVLHFRVVFGPGTNRELFAHSIGGPVYAVLITSWFVAPIGGALGAAMPRIVGRCSQFVAFIRGSLPGLCAGSLAAILTVVFVDAWAVLFGGATVVNRAAWEQRVRENLSTIS